MEMWQVDLPRIVESVPKVKMHAMPVGVLRFCRECLVTCTALTGEACAACDCELLPLLDSDGAISREFLTARGSCCNNGCRNCPYDKGGTTTGQCVACTTRKTCQRCKACFECRSGDCWCDNVRLRPATLKWLMRSYDGCLCPSCLAEFATR